MLTRMTSQPANHNKNALRWFPRPSGRVSARIHGAAEALRQWSKSADELSRSEVTPEAAAAFRGKRRAYLEAAELLDAIEQGHRLSRRWGGRR